MRTYILGALLVATFGAPLMAHERLVGSTTAGLERICIYRALLPGVGADQARTVRVGLGMPCPVIPTLAEPKEKAPVRVPVTAQLESQAEVAGRTVCRYRFGTRRYEVPLAAGRQCALTPSGL
jgi:hypothetical protein